MSMQPKLVYLLFCEAANFINNQDGKEKVMLIEPMMNYTAPFLPTQLSFTIAGGIDKIEPNRSYALSIKLIGPDGKELYEQSGNINQGIQNNPQIPPNISFVIDLRNIPVTSEGEYEVKVFLDEMELGNQIVSVFKRV